MRLAGPTRRSERNEELEGDARDEMDEWDELGERSQRVQGPGRVAYLSGEQTERRRALQDRTLNKSQGTRALPVRPLTRFQPVLYMHNGTEV